jgi:hypothetical protein
MKTKDVTPLSFSCIEGHYPSVYETDQGTYLIIGRNVDFPENLLSGKIGLDETIIEIPANLVQGIAMVEEQI